jgi:hypothetical protein
VQLVPTVELLMSDYCRLCVYHDQASQDSGLYPWDASALYVDDTGNMAKTFPSLITETGRPRLQLARPIRPSPPAGCACTRGQAPISRSDSLRA